MTSDKFGKAPAELLKAQKWANRLDSAFKVPILPFSIGLDSIVGLIPGVGDGAMLLAGYRIISLAKEMNMPQSLINKMIRNSLLDFALGLVPLVGDAADLLFKSNQKNVRIMEKWWLSNNKAEGDNVIHKNVVQWRAKTS